MLPEVIRQTYHWDVGQELFVVDSRDGVLLTSKPLFEPTTLEDVAGCLQYAGPAKTLDEMRKSIVEGVRQTAVIYD